MAMSRTLNPIRPKRCSDFAKKIQAKPNGLKARDIAMGDFPSVE